MLVIVAWPGTEGSVAMVWRHLVKQPAFICIGGPIDGKVGPACVQPQLVHQGPQGCQELGCTKPDHKVRRDPDRPEAVVTCGLHGGA
jgi:hypothetical protein